MTKERTHKWYDVMIQDTRNKLYHHEQQVKDYRHKLSRLLDERYSPDRLKVK
jgi:hypothetical protein